jgi:hypothetical protein
METKEQLIQAIITYLNFDSVSDERWHNPFSDERQTKVRKDAEKITELVTEIYK